MQNGIPDTLKEQSASASADSPLSQGRVLFTRLVTHGRLRQLQLLVQLEECGSIMKAAARLNMSQSSATQALAELERILDLQLLDRHARGSRLTSAGRALVHAARGALEGFRDAADTLAAIHRGAVAALKLGATSTAAHALMLPLLSPFYETHPDVHLELHEDTGARLLPTLIAGSLDAVFCRAPAQLPDGYEFEPLLHDEAVVVSGLNHEMVGAKDISLYALAGMRWVLPAMNIQMREIFEKVVLEAIPEAQAFPVTTMSLLVIEGLLMQPQAVALLPRSIALELQSSHRVRQLDIHLNAPLAPLGVAYRQGMAPALLAALLEPAREGTAMGK